VDPQGLNARLARARGALDSFIDKIIEEHVQKKKNGNGVCDGETDMVDELLAFYTEEAKLNNEPEDFQNSIRLTKDNIKAIIMVSTHSFYPFFYKSILFNTSTFISFSLLIKS